MPAILQSVALGLMLSVSPLATRALAQLSVWETFGPPLFQVSAVAAGPDLTVYASGADYAASQGALFKSVDGGRIWEPVAEAARNEYYSDVLVDPRNPQRVYAGALGNTGATNVYRSTDGGGTWSLSDTVSPYCVPSFAPGTASDTVLLACGTRFLRSDDAGMTWHDLTAPFTEPTRLTTGPGGVLLAFGPTRIFKSTSDGNAWAAGGNAPQNCLGLNALRVDPRDARGLVAGTGLIGTGGFQCGGVFRSTDAGGAWSASSLSGVYVTDVAIDSDEPALVYACASYLAGILPKGGVFFSRDGGAGWNDLHLPALGAVRIALAPSGRLLYAATSLGVFEHRVRKTQVVGPRP